MLNKTAQSIATKSSKIIKNNVFVTDENGYIIGSSKEGMDGVLCQPAIHTVRTGNITELKNDKNGPIKNGIILPVTVQNQTTSTVIVEGRAEEVHEYGLLIQQNAQVMLREERFINSELSRKRAKRDLVKNIASFDRKQGSIQFIKAQAGELNWDIHKTRIVVVFEMTDWTASVEDSFVTLTNELRNSLISPDNFTCTHGNYSITLFYAPLPIINDDMILIEHTRKKAREFVEQMKNKNISVKVTIGFPVQSPEYIGVSLRSAREMLDISSSLGEKGVIVATENTAKMLLSLLPPEESMAYSNRILENITGRNDFDDIKVTFLEWCVSPFKSSETAERLAMHRNSLQYRLKKIRALTGKDPWSFNDAFELWAAFVLSDMKSQQNSFGDKLF